MPPEIVTFIAAELLFLIVRSKDIQVCAKRLSQLTSEEQYNVESGLLRSIVLEILIFVPASAGLVLLVSPVLIPKRLTLPENSEHTVYALLGIVSYGFPFAAMRRLVTHAALKTLKEFADLTPERKPLEPQKKEGEED